MHTYLKKMQSQNANQAHKNFIIKHTKKWKNNVTPIMQKRKLQKVHTKNAKKKNTKNAKNTQTMQNPIYRLLVQELLQRCARGAVEDSGGHACVIGWRASACVACV